MWNENVCEREYVTTALNKKWDKFEKEFCIPSTTYQKNPLIIDHNGFQWIYWHNKTFYSYDRFLRDNNQLFCNFTETEHEIIK